MKKIEPVYCSKCGAEMGEIYDGAEVISATCTSCIEKTQAMEV